MHSKKRWLVFVLISGLSMLTLFFSGPERSFFLRRMIQQPRLVGSIAPSSKSLAQLMLREALMVVKNSDDFVVEIGPGTGCITRVILDHGIAAERLICVEMDTALHQYMTEQFPDVNIIQGDAVDLATILPEKRGKIAVIVSGVPLKNLSLEKEKKIIQACCTMLRPDGKLIQFTYGVRPPAAVIGLRRKFIGFALFNLPPAFVWSFIKVGIP